MSNEITVQLDYQPRLARLEIVRHELLLDIEKKNGTAMPVHVPLREVRRVLAEHDAKLQAVLDRLPPEDRTVVEDALAAG